MDINKKGLSLNFRNINYINIDIILSKNNIANTFFCKNQYDILNYFKSFISKNNNINNWDINKKISNNYELININQNNSITYIRPLSRSFYKFHEIINDFNLVNLKNYSLRYAALAEGPGGFIESFINFRKKVYMGKEDYIQCMTLKSDSKEIPNWDKAKKYLYLSNIYFCYGEDNTGDLYNIENIKYFRKKMNNNTANIVTADGGFDYSVNFSQQEQQSYKLIFAEIVCAYGVCKKDGHFILKIFDNYTLPTLKLIYLLGTFFKEIVIIKPNTSRPANSEKYIIGKFFKGFDQKIFNNLIYNLNIWNKYPDYNLIDIKGIHLPSSFLYNLVNYNKIIVKSQIKNILKTLIFIKLKIECEELLKVRKLQILYSISWCKKYNIPINYKNKLMWLLK